MINSGFDKNILWSGAILLQIAVLYALLSYFTPFAYDDWMFMSVWNEVNGEKSLSFSTLYDFWKEIRLYDNGRLANTFSPLSTMFSPWKEAFPVATGIMVAMLVYMSTVMSFSKRRMSPFGLAIVWGAMIFMLPWRNSLFVADYSLNYIWAAALTMCFMIAVVKFERSGWNIGAFILTLLLAFLAGGWHEGFAIATLCGFLLYTIKGRLRFSPQWYFTGIFYAAAAIAFLYCPGIIARSERQFGVNNIGQSMIKILFDFLPVLFLLFIVGVTAVIPSLRRYLKEAWRNVWFVVGIGIIIGGSLLSLLFTHHPRSAFWPDLMAIIMIFILTAPIWNKLGESRFNWDITSLMIAVCLIPIIFTLIWQYRLYKESEIILKKMESSPSGTVYHDIIPGSSIPLLTLKMTNHPAWITDFHYHSLREYTGKPYPAVLPESMSGLAIKDGKPLQGNAGAVKFDGGIVLPGNLYGKPSTVSLDIILDNGEETEAPALLLPFLSDDNEVMSYIVVYGISVDDIEGISL